MKFINIQNPENLNQTYIDVRRAFFFQFMKVNSAKEALEIMSKSSRIISDLSRAKEYQELWKEQKLNIVVREFIEFDITQEFRGFYYGRKLRGLCQYDTNCFFEVPKDLESRAIQFIDSLSLEKDCIIDLVITNSNIWIVELNPFSQSSGCALFNWEKDYQQLTQGKFEFRKLEKEKPTEYLKAILSPWNSFIQESIENKQSWCIII